MCCQQCTVEINFQQYKHRIFVCKYNPDYNIGLYRCFFLWEWDKIDTSDYDDRKVQLIYKLPKHLFLMIV